MKKSRYKEKSRYAGFLAFESLIMLLVLVTLLAYLLWSVRISSERSDRYFSEQSRFNRLTSVADYIVKRGAAYEAEDRVYPNWIDEGKLATLDSGALGRQAGLAYMSAGWSEGQGTCLFRLVVAGEKKEIRKLYVCGG